MNSFGSAVKEMSANAKAAASGVKGLGFLIVVLGVVFSDVAFIWLFWNAFPPGIFRIASVLGAFVTTLSVIGLYIGKSKWFRPGAQLIWAWIFAGIEIAVSVMNVIASFYIARGGNAGDLAYWINYVAPSTPWIAVIGWFLISWFDEDRKRDHARMEMEDKLHNANLEYEQAARMAQIEVKKSYLQHGQQYLQEELNSDHIQIQMHQASANTMSQVLSDATGHIITPRRFTASNHQPIQQQPPALPQPVQLPIVPPAEQVDLTALQRHLMQLQHTLSGLSQTPVPSNGTKEPQTSPLAEMALGQTEDLKLPKSQDQNQQNGKK